MSEAHFSGYPFPQVSGILKMAVESTELVIKNFCIIEKCANFIFDSFTLCKDTY